VASRLEATDHGRCGQRTAKANWKRLGALDPGLVRDLAVAGARHPDMTRWITMAGRVYEQGPWGYPN
jgi:hypothetical protein